MTISIDPQKLIMKVFNLKAGLDTLVLALIIK